MFILGLLVCGGLLALWANKVELHAFQINRHDVTLRRVLAVPLKILHLSDIHFARPNLLLSRFFSQLAGEEFDLIVLTGDIIDCEEGIHTCVDDLKKLKAKHGFFAVFGNHDYYDYQLKDVFCHDFPGQTYPQTLNPTDVLQRALEGIGVKVLRNQTFETQVGDVSILVHGLDDPTTGHASIRETLKNYDPEKVNLLLTHSIDAFMDVGENEIDLSFSGHSHGGQVCLPLWGPILTHTMLGRAYAAGIVSLKGAVCSVSRGLGYGRCMPFRLLCPPEAVVLNVYGV